MSEDREELKKALATYRRVVDGGRLGNFGGYPDEIDYETIPGYVIIASVIDAGPKPDLRIYTTAEFIGDMQEVEKENEEEDEEE